MRTQNGGSKIGFSRPLLRRRGAAVLILSWSVIFALKMHNGDRPRPRHSVYLADGRTTSQAIDLDILALKVNPLQVVLTFVIAK